MNIYEAIIIHSDVILFLDTRYCGSVPNMTALGATPRRSRQQLSQRRQRTTFSSEQTLHLETEYQRIEYISKTRRCQLAAVLGLSDNQVKIWFQNRRAKEKRIEKAKYDYHTRSGNLLAIQFLV